jgi:hypothetical protein
MTTDLLFWISYGVAFFAIFAAVFLPWRSSSWK